MHRCALGEAVQKPLYAGDRMRRSLTITPLNDKKILLTKGRFLTGDTPLDIDYTTMVNIFIELGHKLMSAGWTDIANPKVVIDKQEIVESFKKYAFNNELKEDAVGDQVTEIIFRKLIEQAKLLPNLQVQQEQNPELTTEAEDTDASSTKMQKYVS
jgi:hypothetical protein